MHSTDISRFAGIFFEKPLMEQPKNILTDETKKGWPETQTAFPS